ncbi:MAG: threonine--tRNA ligase, partial [Thermodesulfovibrionales bacterium]
MVDVGDYKSLKPSTPAEAITVSQKEGLDIYRHSTSHVLAHAIKDLYPDAKFAIGPSTDDGFYYDIDMSHTLKPEDLQQIENRMRQIIKGDSPFIKRVMSRQDAIQYFNERGENYKVEILKDIKEDYVTTYEEGGFVDLCTGPHIPRTGMIKAFKLLSIAGAYWRGDEKNKMLQRVYGTAFESKERLDEYLNFLEEVKKRDHRKIAKDLDLYSINDDIGSGLVLWHPNGAIIRKTIEDFWRNEHIKADYKILFTPHMARLDLWHTSGHLDFY